MSTLPHEANGSNPGGPGRPCALTDPGPPPGVEQIADWLAATHPADHSIEIRAPRATPPGRARSTNVVRRFGLGQFWAAATYVYHGLSGRCAGVYVVMNGIRCGLQLRGGAGAEDVPRRTRLLVDLDPVRPPDTNATDDEKAVAFKLADQVRDYLRDRGWPPPIVADSGNGAHLLYKIDLPNDAPATKLVKGVLAALAARFDTEVCKLDRKVFDAPRLVKVYGSLTAKGENNPERPHRYARVLEIPPELAPVPVEMLEALAAEAAPGPAPVLIDLGAEIERKRVRSAEAGAGTTSGRTPDPEARAVAYLERCEPSVSGQNGHDKAFKAACKIGPGFDLPPETTLRLLHEHFNPRCEPPWSEKELVHKVEQAFKVESRRGFLRDVPPKNPRRNGSAAGPPSNGRHHADAEPAGPTRIFPLTDLGNAERLVDLHGKDIRFAHAWGKWLVFDGRRWNVDNTAAVVRHAKDAVRRIYLEAAHTVDDGERGAIARWAKTSEGRARVESMIKLGAAEAGVPVTAEELDPDPWVLNCLNGTIDLKAGEIRPHRREDMITRLCPVEYDKARE